MNGDPKPVDWETQPPPGWREAVDAWKWREWQTNGTHLGWRKWGACPRCGDTMSVHQDDIKGFNNLDGVEVWCNCTAFHPGRPDAIDGGCGAGFARHVRIQAVEVAP